MVTDTSGTGDGALPLSLSLLSSTADGAMAEVLRAVFGALFTRCLLAPWPAEALLRAAALEALEAALPSVAPIRARGSENLAAAAAAAEGVVRAAAERAPRPRDEGFATGGAGRRGAPGRQQLVVGQARAMRAMARATARTAAAVTGLVSSTRGLSRVLRLPPQVPPRRETAVRCFSSRYPHSCGPHRLPQIHSCGLTCRQPRVHHAALWRSQLVSMAAAVTKRKFVSR